MELYHASKEIVQYPEVRKGKVYKKIFSWGIFIAPIIFKTGSKDGQIAELVIR